MRASSASGAAGSAPDVLVSLSCWLLVAAARPPDLAMRGIPGAMVRPAAWPTRRIPPHALNVGVPDLLAIMTATGDGSLRQRTCNLIQRYEIQWGVGN